MLLGIWPKFDLVMWRLFKEGTVGICIERKAKESYLLTKKKLS